MNIAVQNAIWHHKQRLQQHDARSAGGVTRAASQTDAIRRPAGTAQTRKKIGKLHYGRIRSALTKVFREVEREAIFSCVLLLPVIITLNLRPLLVRTVHIIFSHKYVSKSCNVRIPGQGRPQMQMGPRVHWLAAGGSSPCRIDTLEFMMLIISISTAAGADNAGAAVAI